MEREDRLSLQGALHFRDEFREARLVALKDAEAFHDILYTIERLGLILKGRQGDMGKYKKRIGEEAESSALAAVIPKDHRAWHTTFSNLYELVRVGRNDAMHQGAFARNLTVHATQLALILEDALTKDATMIGDFMVRGPVCAVSWQPVSFVRQQMLVNSFSYLPVEWESEQGTVWKLISDFRLAQYLRVPNDPDGSERKSRLAKTVRAAVDEKQLTLERAEICSSESAVEEAMKCFSGDGRPLLVHHPDDSGRLMGIATAYDLL